MSSNVLILFLCGVVGWSCTTKKDIQTLHLGMGRQGVLSLLGRQLPDSVLDNGLEFRNVHLLGTHGTCTVEFDSLDLLKTFHVQLPNDLTTWHNLVSDCTQLFGNPSLQAHTGLSDKPQTAKLEWQTDTTIYSLDYNKGNHTSFSGEFIPVKPPSIILPQPPPI